MAFVGWYNAAAITLSYMNSDPPRTKQSGLGSAETAPSPRSPAAMQPHHTDVM